MIINKNIYIHSFVLIVCLVFLFLTGCASTIDNNQFRLTSDKRIIVIPFVSSAQQDLENNQTSINKYNNEPNIYERLTNELISRLRQKEFTNINLLPEIHDSSLNQLVVDKKEKPDVILYCRVLRYKERKGSKYAVSSPASVALEIKVLDPLSRKVICRYEFNETQQALSENICNINKFFARKGQWVTAFDLAIYGIAEFVKTITD